MKNVNKLRLIVLMTIGVLIYSCQNQDGFSPETVESVAEIDTSKLIDFKGLIVNHRFSTPLENLEITHTEEVLKQIYSISKQRATKNGITSRTNDSTLPSGQTVVEATQTVLDLFPYQEIPEDITQEKDSIALEIEAQEHWDMIKQDFPTLTETEIEENIETIDEYYSQNLNYVVLNEIAENEDNYAGRIQSRNYDQYICVYGKIISIEWGFARATYAMILSSTRASTSAGNYYPGSYGGYYGYVGGGGTNTRGDAYRHILWSALLADYYFTVSSKVKRINFAKAVGDANEECNTSGLVDSRAMDYHNNAIGRKIWNDNTYYINFLGVAIGLNTPSTSRLKDLTRHAVNRNSCFVVKVQDNNVFPNELLTQTQTAPQIKAKIDATHPTRAVYFAGTIAPSWYEWEEVVTGYDYTPCYNGDYTNCPTIVYENVQVERIPCYQL